MPLNVPKVNLHDTSGRFTSRNQGILWTGLDVMAKNINRRGNTLNRTRREAMERTGREMEAWMKTNAPWDDRTGDARGGLRVVVVHNESAQISTLTAGHGVGYGLWLETMQQGRFAIILPAITEFAKRMPGTIREVDSTGDAFARVFGE